jgi:UDP-N-acetyl-D-glucosamine/UDP-N-acetyl-D-galactosamine dehydrogenase
MRAFPLTTDEARIGVVGLGYVGLPLAVAFARHLPVLGFDVDANRIEELRSGHDKTLEVAAHELKETKGLRLSADDEALRDCNVFIVTVPTPIDRFKRPDLEPLESACRTVGRALSQGALVVFESTVYPGCTEEVCVPILEQRSGLRFNSGFYLGYSPERINPGDPERRLENIMKVTSGSTPEAADFVDALYRKIISAGTHKASSIRVAEAAKVIENTQRDVNIALVNELALIFNRLGLDTMEVLRAAGTKWNFLAFRPGLVGGHCIGVDPYYLTHKCKEIGYQPEVILAGRRINDGMGAYVAATVVKLLTQRRIHVVGARILVLGLTFKENCPDLRNSRVIDIVREFEIYHAQVDVLDPWTSSREAEQEYGLKLIGKTDEGSYDAVILAVAHRQFSEWGAARIRSMLKPNGILYDVKSVLPAEAVDARL